MRSASFLLASILLWTLTAQIVAEVNDHDDESDQDDPVSMAMAPDDSKSRLKWKAPMVLEKNFPYFLSGFDSTGCPVWVLEFGHWDIRSLVEKGGSSLNQAFDLYIDQLWERLDESPRRYSSSKNADDPCGEYVIVIDLDGYGFRQATHYPSLQKLIHMAKRGAALSRERGLRAKAIVLINGNYFFQTAFRFIKPALGEIAAVVELYGTSKQTWVRALRNQYGIPRDQLPDWMGGSSSWAGAVKVYG